MSATGLTAAICAVMTSVRNVEKGGRNSFHGYDYASEADFLRAIQPAMAANGLAMIPVVVAFTREPGPPTGKGRAQWVTSGVVTYELRHTSGESVTVQAPASGIDGEDKGAYKAMTGALKYALRQVFLIPTGDDPEADHVEPATRVDKAAKAADKAARQSTHDPEWEANKGKFFAALTPEGLAYDDLAGWCEAIGASRPSAMTTDERRRLFADVRRGGGRRVELEEWLAKRDEGGGR